MRTVSKAECKRRIANRKKEEMAGGGNTHQKASSKKQQPSSSSPAPHHRKPHPDSKPSPSKQSQPKPKPKPSPKLNPSPHPRPETFPPPPTYGFHMLDRRTILLADGSDRSYLALPPDYQDSPQSIPRPLTPDSWKGFDRQFPPNQQQNQDYWNSLHLEGSRKRKFGDEVNDEFVRQRQQLLQYGNNNSNNGSYVAGPSSRVNPDEMRAMIGNEIDQGKLKTAFLNFIKVLNEKVNQKKKYCADGKHGSLQCLACPRSSKDFPDMHSLIMHTYNPEKSTSEQVPDHLGLHKALCVLMGWNYLMPPDNSKAYQRLSPEEAAANRDDLIMWPPHVIIHNTATGRSREGRMEGIRNKAMDMKLRDLGFTTGKSKATYGRFTTGKSKATYSKEGHQGITVVEFAGDQSGLKDAMRLADFFEKEKHGRGSWENVQPMFRPGKEDEKDPNFVKLDEKTGEKERILYGYLGIVFDLEGLYFDFKKKVTIESKRERADAN